MSVLSQKLQQASKLYQSHQFKKSNEAYDDCLKFAQNTQECLSVIHNILSTKASLQYVLGQYSSALATTNQVLKKDPFHFLCLLRRSQIYKKTNKLKRALKDLQRIFVFCPDNLHVSALKVEIQHLILKQNRQDQTSSSEEQEEQQEEQSINFMRLKSIDRRSSQMSNNVKSRKSRVTILGDITYEYKTEQQTNIESLNLSSEDIRDKALRTYKQIELDDSQDENEQEAPIVRIKAPKARGKSILKNKMTSIFIHPQQKSQRRSKYLGRQSNLLAMIKNIDGKVVPSSENIKERNSGMREVQFRKSVSLGNLIDLLNLNCESLQKQSTASKSSKRKSCLKRPSFQVVEQKGKPVRRGSKFDNLKQKNIDGPIISKFKPRKSIQGEYYNKDEVEESKKDSVDSENQDSSHNIFGSKNFFLTSDMRMQLGIQQNPTEAKESAPKLKSKKSILKSSRLSSFSPKRETSQSPFMLFAPGPAQTSKNNNGRKKSVMFSGTL